MSLFTVIPENFFSILASKNREVYSEALLVLFDALQSDEMAIKKADYVRTLREKYRDLIMHLDFESEGEEETSLITSETLPTKAAFVVRRLEECGWIDIEIDPDTLEEYIALPSYSISFLTLLNELVRDDESEYVSLVHSTYTELKMEDEVRDEFMYTSLLRAFENTKKLRTELVTLGHSIRIFQNRLGRIFSTNKILSDYFDIYKTRISDKYYHPLKTFDSVAKFKRPIIQILQGWLYDEDAREQLVNQSLLWSRKKDAKHAEQDIIYQINYICDMFETLSSMIASIDEKHQDYTKATASKILYLNHADKTIKGHLDNIFKIYAEYIITDKSIRPILNAMQDSVVMSTQGYVTPDSVTLPIVRRYREAGEPLRIVDFDAASEMLMQGFLDETRNIFNDARVWDFMEMSFGDDSEINVKEIPLPDYDAFILLILATLKTNDEQCFYTVEKLEGQVHSYGFSLPNLLFKRKELEA